MNAGISGHLIRRTDTDAVSASSLFRAAFPYASQEAEAAEMAHVAKSYDTVKVRLWRVLDILWFC